jgi:hypothetical protein
MFCDIAENLAIIINSETGIYYGINNFGTQVFEAIIKGAPKEDILANLNALQGAPPDMEQRLTDFINTLIDKEIIVAAPTVQSEISIHQAYAERDDFTFAFDEYADAQELLLADPIHDVDEETGWQPLISEK